MLGNLPAYALRLRAFVVFLGVVLAGVGVLAFLNLKVEAYPDISDTQAVVITTYPGYAAEEVEQQITVPIELALNGVPSVIGRRSRTIFGLSVVELTFADGVSDFEARQLVLEKLRAAELPAIAVSELGPLSSGIGEMYRYQLVSDHHDEMALRVLQDWVMVPRIMQATGVADVVTFGGDVKQYQVEVDPFALEKYGLSITGVAEAIQANNENAGGGVLDTGEQALVVRSVGQLTSAADVANTVVGASEGVPIFVRDIARVKIGPAPHTGLLGVNEQQGGVEGIVLMRRWSNPSEVLRSVKGIIQDLDGSNELEGARIVPLYDRQDLVDNTLRTVSRTLTEGIIVVVLVSLFFLGSVRAALLTAITIPLSLMFAFICMRVAGVPANLLSLGAIDFGVIVDGTLVMVECIVHRVGPLHDPNTRLPIERFKEAALQVSRPILFSLAIIISAYLPLFMLERVERRLFAPMAFTVCAALLGSLLLALTLVPALSSFLFAHGAKTWQNPVVSAIARAYGAILRAALRVPALLVVVSLAIVPISLGLGRGVGTEFLPQLDEGVIWIRCNLPPGISLERSAAIASEIRELAMLSPEVRTVISQSGRNDSGTDPFGPNRNEFLLDLQPYETWPGGKVKADLVDELAQRLRAAIPGATFSFTQPIIDTSTEMATGSSADLAVIIRGPNLETLRRLATATRDQLATVHGAADTAIEQEAAQVQLRIRLQRPEMARYGIDVTDVQNIVGMAIGGRPIDTVYERERRFRVALRFVAEARENAEAISWIMIPTRQGGRIPLRQVADIEVVEGATIIARRDNQRQITVRTNIRGRDQGGFVAEAQRVVGESIALPPGYHIEWGGQFENLDRARRRMVVIFPITISIIFMLLYFAFRSIGYALLVFVSVPLSLVGGIAALAIRGINLSVSAGVGFVSLFGVAVMSGVLLVDAIGRERARGLSVEEATLQGALTQLRPLLMMIVVAMLGMMPAALATGIGSDVQRPLATVLVGGLASTLLLTPVILPCLYLFFARRTSPRSTTAAQNVLGPPAEPEQDEGREQPPR